MFTLNKIKKKENKKTEVTKHKQTKTNHRVRSWAFRENRPISNEGHFGITTDIYNEKRNLPPAVRTFTWP